MSFMSNRVKKRIKPDYVVIMKKDKRETKYYVYGDYLFNITIDTNKTIGGSFGLMTLLFLTYKLLFFLSVILLGSLSFIYFSNDDFIIFPFGYALATI